MQSSAKYQMYYRTQVPDLNDSDFTKYEAQDLALTRQLLSKGYRRNHATKRPERVLGPLTPYADSIGITHKLRFR